MGIPECYQCGHIQHGGTNYRSRCVKCQKEFLAAHTKIVVAGGRSYTNYEVMATALDHLFSEAIGRRESIMIVSGAAKGADLLGERYAAEREYELLRMPAQWDTFGKSAGYKRNVEMANVANGVVVFWDGESKGAKHMIDIAESKNLPTRIIHY